MFPNPLGNPAIEMFNRSVSDSLDNASRMMSMQPTQKREELHKECQASSEDVAEAQAIVIAEHKTTRSEVKVPKAEWERLQSIVHALANDHDMLNKENKEYRRELVRHRA
jgi:cobyric acid synthase